MTTPSAEPLLQVEDLRVGFKQARSTVPVVRDVTFDVYPGETLCVVGESGSGKSVTFLGIVGLLPRSGVRSMKRGVLAGRDLTTMTRRDYVRMRGADVGIVFQDPMTSLDPLFTIGSQLVEALRAHDRTISRADASARAIDLLAEVGIPEPAHRVRQYPHEFSGGMRQRVMIAIAAANSPSLLIADEPTTALDVTVQAQVLDRLLETQQERGSAMVLITHDLRLARDVADRVLVMYAGQIVESGPADVVLDDPKHPYTRGLLRSLPGGRRLGQRLMPIVGAPVRPGEWTGGCAFQPRCGSAEGRSICLELDPPVTDLEASRTARCHLLEDDGGQP